MLNNNLLKENRKMRLPHSIQAPSISVDLLHTESQASSDENIVVSHTIDGVSGSDPSYDHILRSSAIIGGARGITYFVGLVRTKIVALLLGPEGVGLVGLYVSITDLMSTISQVGIDQSGVRAVAEANGAGESERVAQLVKTLRRICWITGFFGWALTATLSWPLSRLAFGSTDNAAGVAVLGATVLLACLAGGRTAVIHGMRRIGDLARMQIIAAIINSILAVGVYASIGSKGIVPVIVGSALVQLGIAWHFSSNVKHGAVRQSWSSTFQASRQLLGLGAALMYGLVLSGVVAVVIRSCIVRELGLDANGIFQAAWGISGMFATFVLGAMGADFYPRLAAVVSDSVQTNRIVNEQIEIGVLLALPGIMATLAFAPWLMQIFYSNRFEAGATLLPIFAIGVFFQVVSWPVGMIQMARGAGAWIVLLQTEGNLLHWLLATSLLRTYGLVGVAQAFAVYVVIHGLLVILVTRHTVSYRISKGVIRLVLAAVAILLIGILVGGFEDSYWRALYGVAVTSATVAFSLRGLTARLEGGHVLIRLVCRIPGGKLLIRKGRSN